MDKSWFSTKLYTAQNQNSLRIYSQSFTSFPTECTDSENTLKKSKKIYLKLSQAQKRKIKYWFGVSKFLWKGIKRDVNAAVNILNILNLAKQARGGHPRGNATGVGISTLVGENLLEQILT
ncbi:hypothetical protein NWP17_10200 [Chrysosporum bergii ANA360D]|uniref:Transposase n=1 Tax=Chrysosporum bergii ANA360D TaxID=617107 RepID=A0AA43KC94_9CYAN|nr:hypothetical protein [Chrysosporum bergii]MDH6060810.1 hypothetical protein [Chrysosporum bergii ANA360D]